MLDTTHAQLAYLDRDMNFVAVNAAYAEGSGYTREQLIGRNHFRLFPNAENERIFAQVRDSGVPATFYSRPFVYASRPELGTTYWDWTLRPVRDENGTIEGLLLSLVDVTEGERARAERERLIAILQSTPDLVATMTVDGRVTHLNEAARRMLNLSADAMPESLAPLYPTWAWQTLEHTGFPRALRTGIWRGELAVLDQAGHEVPVSQVIIAHPSPEGGVEYLSAVARDLSEQVVAQRQLERYARRLRQLHDTDSAILEAGTLQEIADAAVEHLARMTSLTRACVALFDWPADTMTLISAIPCKGSELVAGWSAPLDAVWFIDTLKEGRTYFVQDLSAVSCCSCWLSALQPAGIRTFISLPLVAKGELIGALSLGAHTSTTPTAEEEDVIREIARHMAIALHQARLESEIRRHAVELEALVVQRTARLQTSEARFRSIFEEAPVGIALLGLDGHIHSANPAFQQILRYSALELAEMTLAELVEPDGSAGDLPLPAAGQRRRLERRFRRKDGKTVWASLTLCLVRRPGRRRPRFWLAMLEDITARKEAADALLQTEKLAVAGRLAASLTHEINNPLQSVLGCLGLAQEALAEGEGAEQFLEVALEELRRAAGIVSRLRDLQHRSPKEDREPTDLGALIEQVLTLTARKCADQRIEVLWQPDPSLPTLPVVSDHIRQVFLNVILNAIEAMPNGGRLQVSITPTTEPAGLATAISDTGVGIPPEVLERLFEPFFSTRPDGLGLGLHISRNIIEDHGGRIEVASEQRHGTTFTIWLPAR